MSTVVTLDEVRASLANVLTPGAGDEWLHCRIPALDGQRPLDLIADVTTRGGVQRNDEGLLAQLIQIDALAARRAAGQ